MKTDIEHNYSSMHMFYSHLISFMQLGGMNSFLLSEVTRSIPLFSNIPTLIIGMDVSHGSPYQLNVPSIAAVWYSFTSTVAIKFDINHKRKILSLYFSITFYDYL
jgi:hypothetical protein